MIDAEGERLIIPIINHLDEVIAFGGRLLEKSDRAKYKNTRETVIFNKSKNLYNINLVKKEKRAGGLSSIIMVEGYMDAISLYEAGFKNVVASMGTSLTKEQARLCKRYSENVLISYDGDFAGQKANLRGLEILKQEGVKVRVVPMPDGLDPDDVIRRQGADGYRACLDRAMPLIDFRIHAAGLKYDLKKTDEKRDFIREALPIVKEAESATEREVLLKRIASETGVTLSSLQRDLEGAKAPPAAEEERPPAKEDNADKEKKAARFILAACLLSKKYAADCDLASFEFSDPDHRAIAEYVISSRAAGMVRPSGIFDVLGSDSAELSEVLNLDFGDNLDSDSAVRYFNDCKVSLARKSLGERIAHERERYRNAVTSEEKREILSRIDEYTKNMKKLSFGGRI